MEGETREVKPALEMCSMANLVLWVTRAKTVDCSGFPFHQYGYMALAGRSGPPLVVGRPRVACEGKLSVAARTAFLPPRLLGLVLGLLASNLVAEDPVVRAPIEPALPDPGAPRTPMVLPPTSGSLRADHQSGILFVGLIIDPAVAGFGMEYSPDLKHWTSLVPLYLPSFPPPPPPIALLDALKPATGQNLLVVPMAIEGTHHGFYRVKQESDLASSGTGLGAIHPLPIAEVNSSP
jgi:hypothetical protein